MPAQNITGFSGSGGPGDTINLSVPLPGSHTGRRIIEIKGIPDSAWSDDAKEAGTDYASKLGIEKGDIGYVLTSPELLIEKWSGWLSTARSIRKLAPDASSLSHAEVASTIDSVFSAALKSAHDFKTDKGHLQGWPSTADIALPTPTDTKTQLVARSTTASKTPNVATQISKASATSAVMSSIASTFQRSMASLSQGIVEVPVETWGGGMSTVPLDLTEESQPRLFIIHVLGISSFLADYGLGRTVKTFTLLPGEETTISMRTWRATEESRSESSSIIDSYDESSADRFAETVQDETTDTSTQSESSNWQIEGEASASWGWGKASVSGGKGGGSASSTEEFARSMEEAVSEHTAEASSHRENTVTSSSESSESSETETVIERTIKNINVKRVLNFVFRELNQTYSTKIHLKDIRIAFSNGRSGSWREVPLSGLAGLLTDLIKDTATMDSVAKGILSQIAVMFDSNDLPTKVLQKVTMGPCGASFESIADAQPGDNCEYAVPPTDGSWYYRFKRGELNQEEEDHPVDGLVLREREVVLRTDSVVVEALLGTADAVDTYAAALQEAAVRERQLANKREELAQRIVNSKDTNAAEVFAQVFPAEVEEDE